MIYLEKRYPKFKFTVQIEEQHHIEVSGVEFDFFSTDPEKRVEKNYFTAELSWIDTGLSHNDQMIKQMDEVDENDK